MRKNGFTLIELLAVIVILAIIALIATPIILNIINDAKRESQERSVELYASAVRNGLIAYQLNEGKKYITGRHTSADLDFIEYKGNVECDVVEYYDDGSIYIEGCKVNDVEVDYTYGKKQVPFADDDWSTIVANVKAGNLNKYNVGDTREISLTGFTNTETDNEEGTYTIRVANTSTPSECSTEGFSQTACGFVIEFEDIITTHKMNEDNTNVGGWEASLMRTYVNSTIYESLPEDLRNKIISTTTVSGHGSTSGEENFTTTDNLYLLSPTEIYGKFSSDTSAELTRQLDYYSNLNVTTSNYSSAIKKLNGKAQFWWLRSAYPGSTNYFRRVRSDGRSNYNNANGAFGVSIAFRIG